MQRILFIVVPIRYSLMIGNEKLSKSLTWWCDEIHEHAELTYALASTTRNTT